MQLDEALEVVADLAADTAAPPPKAIGELALILTAPAIFTAIHHGTSARLIRAPATSGRARVAIQEAGR